MKWVFEKNWTIIKFSSYWLDTLELNITWLTIKYKHVSDNLSVNFHTSRSCKSYTKIKIEEDDYYNFWLIIIMVQKKICRIF